MAKLQSRLCLREVLGRGIHYLHISVLCMEVLGQSITKAVEDKRRKPIKVVGNTTHLSHIFFADDLLLFGHASFFQARVMKFILAHFCGFSGQRVNRGKSRTWFSPNTPLYLKRFYMFRIQDSSYFESGMIPRHPFVS